MSVARIYTGSATEQGLEQDFNPLNAQREASSEAYIKSQVHEGWRLVGGVIEGAVFF